MSQRRSCAMFSLSAFCLHVGSKFVEVLGNELEPARSGGPSACPLSRIFAESPVTPVTYAGITAITEAQPRVLAFFGIYRPCARNTALAALRVADTAPLGPGGCAHNLIISAKAVGRPSCGRCARLSRRLCRPRRNRRAGRAVEPSDALQAGSSRAFTGAGQPIRGRSRT